MKFINYLESISGVSIYPMMALILFGSVFLIATLMTFSARKEEIQKRAQLPLDDK